ncbi:hypothetical protein ACKKBG_A20530 [Auxenochlorella protothecoides x Auxenochlorella symbiontica]
MASALYKSYSVRDQTVLISGASSGIGEACAWRFAEAGCRLILVARRLERLQALKDKLTQEYKVPIYVESLDVQSINAITSLPDRLPEDFKAVDILVNNAGLALGSNAIHENLLEDVATMVNTNILSVLAFCRTFIPGMVKRNRGHVINMSSIAGHEAYVGGSGYCATKHAVDAMTKAARHDLNGTDIRVTSISPGAVRTEFSVVRTKGDLAAEAAVYAGIDPLRAADIADNVLYAATRPPHVQVADIVVLASYQSSARNLARVKLPAAQEA